MLKGEEDALFERSLSHDLAKHIVLGLHVLRFDGSDPSDKGLSLGSERAPPHHAHHEVLLRPAVLVEVTPPAEVVSKLELGLTTAHSVDHFHGGDLVSIDAFTIQIKLPPEEEEFLAHLMADVAIDDGVPLVVLMDHVKGLTIPDSQIESLPVYDVVAEHSLQLVHLGLEVDHNLGS